MDTFKNSTVVGCIDDGINLKFDLVVSKFNSGGKLSDVGSVIELEVQKIVDLKIVEMEGFYKTIDMHSPFDTIKVHLQPSEQNSGVQNKIKEI